MVVLTLDLIVKGGKVFLNGELVDASVGIKDGVIVKIAKEYSMPKAGAYVDAEGSLVLPGMVDMHVHFRDPGCTDEEDFATGTTSAACGGVTTVADMPNTKPPTINPETFMKKVEAIKSKALIDYALYAGASLPWLHLLDKVFKLGAIGLKIYMATTFKELLIPREKLAKVFREASKHGALCLIHGENYDALIKKFTGLNSPLKGPLDYAKVRDARIEWSGVVKALREALETSVRIHICHISSRGVVEALTKARKYGLKVTGETCPHYLLLTSRDLRRAGPLAKVDPPVKSWYHRVALWRALIEGSIDVVASDHAPHSMDERKEGYVDFMKAPSGFAGVELTLCLMLDCVNRGLLTISRVVELYSTNPARILGLYPKKGVLREGADADLTLVSMNRLFKIREDKLHSKNPQTPFEGRLVKGAPRITLVRGRVVAGEGEVKESLGMGLMLKRREVEKYVSSW